MSAITRVPAGVREDAAQGCRLRNGARLLFRLFSRHTPVLITFYKTPLQPGERPESRANRIEIRDIRCSGAMKRELWAFGDEVLCINVVNSVDWDYPESAPATTTC
jgi:hypothetical protein